MNTIEKFGIKYEKPKVFLLQDNGIGISEFAARTCYDSFENSENESIKELNENILDISNDEYESTYKEQLNGINDSKLLGDLAWTYFHHSILEHSVLSFLIKGTSRGVLQEHARHRIQSISVRSTRYTMGSVINAYIAASYPNFNSMYSWDVFLKIVKKLDLFITTQAEYNELQIKDIYEKLNFQYKSLGKEEFLKISVSKSSLEIIENKDELDPFELFEKLESGKKKRNVGDSFKHIVNDNWRVDMVVSFNLRSLKNYFNLRDSGAAYFQIQWLANEMKKATPEKYLKLIIKE